MPKQTIACKRETPCKAYDSVLLHGEPSLHDATVRLGMYAIRERSIGKKWRKERTKYQRSESEIKIQKLTLTLKLIRVWVYWVWMRLMKQNKKGKDNASYYYY